MKEYSKTISLIKDWAEGRGDTLIIVTADHETGGLTVLSNNGAGFLPGVSWSTDYHTGVNVPYYIWGQDQELFQDISDNTGYYTPLLQYFSE
jgi:alkaline phosphatase